MHGRLFTVGLTLMLGLTGAAPAWAHGDGTGVGKFPERALRKAEARILGAEHAAEHARIRRVERRQRSRWRQLSAAQRRRVLERRRRARSRIVARASAVDPLTDGRWNGRVALPVVGVHAAVLPTGKIMYFNRLDAGTPANEARAWLWDPSRPASDPAALREVDPPLNPETGKPVNLFCAGQSLLPDGQLLVTGGNLAYETDTATYKGLNRIYTFDPWSERWTEQPRMAHGRWYPTQTLLADGRTLITSGRDESGYDSRRNIDLEVFNPPATRGGQGSVTKLGEYGALAGSPARPALYPHWFQMPSGSILNAGPTVNDSWALGLAGTTLSSADRPSWAQTRYYGTAVLLPGGPAGSTRVAQIGGYGASGSPEASATSEVFDESRPTAPPVPGPSLVQSRAHHNTVLLPDGSMISVGGGYGDRNGDLRLAGPEHLTAELWDPATNAWRSGPAQFYKRAYHSTALLLPDGRVVSAGDDRDTTRPGKTSRATDVAEIYEPAYLLRPGPRPAITAAPGAIKWNQPFTVRTSSAITRAALMAPGATTHANDMQQRRVELAITPNGAGATLVAPPNASVAPPGYYMLFGLSANGKPSVARWVKLGATASAEPGAVDTVPPAFSMFIGSGKLGRLVRTGLRLKLVTSERGRAHIKLTVARATARRLKLERPARGRVTIRASEQVAPGGRSSFKVKLRRKARRAIEKARKVNVRVRVLLTDAAGNSARHAKTRKFKRGSEHSDRR
jgi:Domain of unknown function (DUF1929)